MHLNEWSKHTGAKNTGYYLLEIIVSFSKNLILFNDFQINTHIYFDWFTTKIAQNHAEVILFSLCFELWFDATFELLLWHRQCQVKVNAILISKLVWKLEFKFWAHEMCFEYFSFSLSFCHNQWSVSGTESKLFTNIGQFIWMRRSNISPYGLASIQQLESHHFKICCAFVIFRIAYFKCLQMTLMQIERYDWWNSAEIHWILVDIFDRSQKKVLKYSDIWRHQPRKVWDFFLSSSEESFEAAAWSHLLKLHLHLLPC